MTNYEAFIATHLGEITFTKPDYSRSTKDYQVMAHWKAEDLRGWGQAPTKDTTVLHDLALRSLYDRWEGVLAERAELAVLEPMRAFIQSRVEKTLLDTHYTLPRPVWASLQWKHFTFDIAWDGKYVSHGSSERFGFTLPTDIDEARFNAWWDKILACLPFMHYWNIVRGCVARQITQYKPLVNETYPLRPLSEAQIGQVIVNEKGDYWQLKYRSAGGGKVEVIKFNLKNADDIVERLDKSQREEQYRIYDRAEFDVIFRAYRILLAMNQYMWDKHPVEKLVLDTRP